MALSFIGKPISLVSHSDVRYRGILAGIDPQASTIQLSNVFSMGTESRKPPEEFIPPNQDPYAYIIFRASEVKDLAVDEPAPRRSVHDDPAVIGSSGPAAPGFNAYPAPAFPGQPGVAPVLQPPAPYPRAPVAPQDAAGPSERATSSTSNNATRRNNAAAANGGSLHTAAASLETVERALGDLRVSGGGRGGRRGQGGADKPVVEIKVPATDFDFQGSNARFDKSAAAPRKPRHAKDASSSDEEQTNPSEDGAEKKKEKEKQKGAYNPTKSFFDSLTSSAHAAPNGSHHRGGGGPRRGAGGRNRREEERERNVATFGEPGGVGLMGPGAYVGGWGGYGRRGGRPRRGASAVGGR
ncbi:hypothetical protein PLICRDRAFT_175924 [Plicaturopsis crispa FD-325 SS-3]|nr:hypothetical protein PLICRDRAFT_175924 [Plicaturopsis crispa FD-325 SS-3]